MSDRAKALLRFPGFFTATQKRVDDAAEIAAFLFSLISRNYLLALHHSHNHIFYS